MSCVDIDMHTYPSTHIYIYSVLAKFRVSGPGLHSTNVAKIRSSEGRSETSAPTSPFINPACA